jgi:hypothetical protein
MALRDPQIYCPLIVAHLRVKMAIATRINLTIVQLNRRIFQFEEDAAQERGTEEKKIYLP